MKIKFFSKFLSFFAGVVDTTEKTFICEYLRDFSKKFDIVLMGNSGAQGTLIYEKNMKSKSRVRLPLNKKKTKM
jgi:hypothetical protein